MAQLWEHSPFSNVARVRFSDPVSYVGWVCGWFSSLLREVFLWVFPFSPLLKNQHFQIPIRSWIVRAFNFWTSSCELLSAPWVNRFHLHLHSNKSTPPDDRGYARMSVGNDTETTGCSHHICYYFYFGNRAEASVPAILIPRKGVTSSKFPIPWASTSGKCTGKGKSKGKDK